MSTHVKGIRPPDEKWRRMKAVYESCKAADIQIPDEVQEFFNWETPDEKGVIVEIEMLECTSKYKDEYSEGLEINIDLLPTDIQIIRFYNSW